MEFGQTAKKPGRKPGRKPAQNLFKTWSKTWFYAGFEQDRSNGIWTSVGLITVVGRVIIVVCVRPRCMRRLRSLS